MLRLESAAQAPPETVHRSRIRRLDVPSQIRDRNHVDPVTFRNAMGKHTSLQEQITPPFDRGDS